MGPSAVLGLRRAMWGCRVLLDCFSFCAFGAGRAAGQRVASNVQVEIKAFVSDRSANNAIYVKNEQ